MSVNSTTGKIVACVHDDKAIEYLAGVAVMIEDETTSTTTDLYGYDSMTRGLGEFLCANIRSQDVENKPYSK